MLSTPTLDSLCVPLRFTERRTPGKSYEVPLLPVVQAILARRRNDSEWVFPTWSASGHLSDPWRKFNAVRKACAARGLTKHFTMHDLRRTFATQLTAAGVPLSVVSKALGHSNVQTTPGLRQSGHRDRAGGDGKAGVAHRQRRQQSRPEGRFLFAHTIVCDRRMAHNGDWRR